MREAIVLAGGLGTRLKGVIGGLPKAMAPVAGRPFLEILLELLAAKGVRRVVLSIGYRAETVVAHFRESFAGLELAYEVEDEPLGTGGALRRALGRCREDHVFVFNGDTYLDLEVEAAEAAWQAGRHPLIVALAVPDTARYGRLVVDDGGRVTGFQEKGVGGAGLINAGCYVLPVDVFDAVGRLDRFSLESDFLAKEVARRDFHAFISKGRFIDIGVPEDYRRAQALLGE